MSEPVAVSASSRVLYLIVCAAPPVQQTADVVPMLQAEGWDVCHRYSPGEPLNGSFRAGSPFRTRGADGLQIARGGGPFAQRCKPSSDR